MRPLVDYINQEFRFSTAGLLDPDLFSASHNNNDESLPQSQRVARQFSVHQTSVDMLEIGGVTLALDAETAINETYHRLLQVAAGTQAHTLAYPNTF